MFVCVPLLGIFAYPKFEKCHSPAYPVALVVKNLPASAKDTGSIPGLGRSPGEGKGFPLQYSGLENSMNCIDHGVTKSQTQLSDFHFTSLESLDET